MTTTAEPTQGAQERWADVEVLIAVRKVPTADRGVILVTRRTTGSLHMMQHMANCSWPVDDQVIAEVQEVVEAVLVATLAHVGGIQQTIPLTDC